MFWKWLGEVGVIIVTSHLKLALDCAWCQSQFWKDRDLPILCVCREIRLWLSKPPRMSCQWGITISRPLVCELSDIWGIGLFCGNELDDEDATRLSQWSYTSRLSLLVEIMTSRPMICLLNRQQTRSKTNWETSILQTQDLSFGQRYCYFIAFEVRKRADYRHFHIDTCSME